MHVKQPFSFSRTHSVLHDTSKDGHPFVFDEVPLKSVTLLPVWIVETACGENVVRIDPAVVCGIIEGLTVVPEAIDTYKPSI